MTRKIYAVHFLMNTLQKVEFPISSTAIKLHIYEYRYMYYVSYSVCHATWDNSEVNRGS